MLVRTFLFPTRDRTRGIAKRVQYSLLACALVAEGDSSNRSIERLYGSIELPRYEINFSWKKCVPSLTRLVEEN